MNGELCVINCLLFSGVRGRVRPLVSADSWPKASLCKDGMKKNQKNSCGKNGVCPIHQIFFFLDILFFEYRLLSYWFRYCYLGVGNNIVEREYFLKLT